MGECGIKKQINKTLKFILKIHQLVLKFTNSKNEKFNLPWK